MKLFWPVVLALTFAGIGSAQIPPNGYWSMPEHSRHARGVLVLHAWWGLNDDVKAYCDRLARAGFVAYAPDLFQGKVVTTREAAQALADSYDSKSRELAAEVDQAAEQLSKTTGGKAIGVVGFSFGAYYALRVSNEEPRIVRAVVICYGTGPNHFDKARASYLEHFAANDEFNAKADVDQLQTFLKKAKLKATFYSYPGTGHWFAEPSVKPAYNKDAAELARKRTVEFLHKNLK